MSGDRISQVIDRLREEGLTAEELPSAKPDVAVLRVTDRDGDSKYWEVPR